MHKSCSKLEDTTKKVAMKIMSRMVYLNRQPKTSDTAIRLEELSRILDWIETN